LLSLLVSGTASWRSGFSVADRAFVPVGGRSTMRRGVGTLSGVSPGVRARGIV
jgi:hypothetical protein